MLIPAVGRYELANRRKARTGTIVYIILFILMLLAPFLTYPDPPPGQEGILVNLGIPDVGQGDENAPIRETTEESSEPEKSQPEELIIEEEPDKEDVDPKPTKPKLQPEKEVVKTEDPEAIALRKKKEKERKEREEADRQKRLEKERKRKAAEEAERKRKAEEARKKAEYEKTKSEIGSLFGGGEGEGKGNTGKPGNQGDPGGDPSSDILEGISTGKGRVGGGLGNRGVRNAPTITDNSQKTGTVVIEVCVDGNGNVIGTPKFTQRGSTTADSRLIDLAKRNAKNWRFAKASIDKQCGTIRYDFKLK